MRRAVVILNRICTIFISTIASFASVAPRRGEPSSSHLNPRVPKMAKWGEGDSRWIVDERRDGTNINGWHWEVRSNASRSMRAVTDDEYSRDA